MFVVLPRPALSVITTIRCGIAPISLPFITTVRVAVHEEALSCGLPRANACNHELLAALHDGQRPRHKHLNDMREAYVEIGDSG